MHRIRGVDERQLPVDRHQVKPGRNGVQHQGIRPERREGLLPTGKDGAVGVRRDAIIVKLGD